MPEAPISESTEAFTLVIVGHVDHGKSTVMGRLLADTGALPEGKLAQVEDYCRRHARPFEYAYLLDALKDERAQGITIEAARIFFRSSVRPYQIIDAPGHREFLRNMVTGAARAEAAVLVIDAAEGLQENSYRHARLLAMLGVRQLLVLINKMDLVGWEQSTYNATRTSFAAFLDGLGLSALGFIPVSGREGDNIAMASEHMPWYGGPSLIEALDGLRPEAAPADLPLRLPVQGVYKFTAAGDARRIVAGELASGSLAAGETLVFYPSGKKARVAALEAFGTTPERFSAGEAAGLTLAEQIYVRRGEIAAKAGEPAPEVATRLRVSLFWLGASALKAGQDYLIKLGTARVPCRVEQVISSLDGDQLEAGAADEIPRHGAGECLLSLKAPLAFDTAAAHPLTSRFVLVADYEISGGGLILEAVGDPQRQARDRVLRRNRRWESSWVTPGMRAERYAQRPALVLITGPRDSGKKPLAKALEQHLFQAGRHVYYLGIGSLLYGVDADLREAPHERAEDLRRLGEVANILLDAGLILVVTAIGLGGDDLALIETALPAETLLSVGLGPARPDWQPDLQLAGPADENVLRIKALLQQRGHIGEWGEKK